jgi:signal transduction histidine kinase
VALRWYLWTLYGACAILLLGSLLSPAAVEALRQSMLHPEFLLAVGLFVLLAYVGERTTLQVSGSIDQSLSTPVHIATILLFPPPFPVLITLLAVVVAQSQKAHKPLYKRAFNVCHPTLAVGLSGALLSLVAVPTAVLRPGHIVEALPLLGMLLALYYFFDVGLLLMVLVLLQRKPAWTVWQATYQPTVLPELAASAIGIVAAVAWTYDHVLLALLILPVIALRLAFRAIADAEARAGMLRRHASQLEAVLACGQRLQLQRAEDALLTDVAETARHVVGSRGAAGYLCAREEPVLRRRVVLGTAEAAALGPAELPCPASDDGLQPAEEGPQMLQVPLTSERAGVVGLLHLYDLPAALKESEQHVLGILASQAVIALENIRLLAHTQEARLEAEAAVRVRDAFLAAASHDLRTPLAALSGRIELVEMRLEDKRVVALDWLDEQVTSARRAARRMATTLEEITDAALLQMGQELAMRWDVVDVGEMVHATARTVAEAAGDPALIAIKVNAPHGLLVDGDRARLERVVQNIIGNAVKYSPRGSPVHVEVREQGQEMSIVVRDTGVGIPADELPRVFTRFYRASTAQGFSGTGLGLAGAKALVEQHGGRIMLDSHVGRGTTVSIFLPKTTVGEHAAMTTS